MFYIVVSSSGHPSRKPICLFAYTPCLANCDFVKHQTFVVVLRERRNILKCFTIDVKIYMFVINQRNINMPIIVIPIIINYVKDAPLFI